jgi:hypothetical protein
MILLIVMHGNISPTAVAFIFADYITVDKCFFKKRKYSLNMKN